MRIDEFVVAVGFEDHVEHVGGPVLVHRDQPLAQRDQRPLQPGPDHRQVLLGDVELGDRAVELGLLGGEPLADRGFLGAQRRDLGGQPVDPVPVVGDRRRQHALAFAHVGELCFLVFELGLEVFGARGGAGREQRDERRRGGG